MPDTARFFSWYPATTTTLLLSGGLWTFSSFRRYVRMFFLSFQSWPIGYTLCCFVNACGATTFCFFSLSGCGRVSIDHT